VTENTSYGKALYNRRMSSKDRKMIAYIVACIGEFARASDRTTQEAYRYLDLNGGIDFLMEFYDTEHLLSLDDAIEDLRTVTLRKRGLSA